MHFFTVESTAQTTCVIGMKDRWWSHHISCMYKYYAYKVYMYGVHRPTCLYYMYQGLLKFSLLGHLSHSG